MIYIWPIIFALIIGLILGTCIKYKPDNPIQFNIGSFIVIMVAGLYMAWQLGSYPYYSNVISYPFMGALVGLILGNLISNRIAIGKEKRGK